MTLIQRFRAAIDAGHLARVREMVEDDPTLLGSVVNIEQGYRPLTEAVVECQLEVVSYLIEAGCDVHEDHNFPMFRASLSGRCVPVLELLVGHGGDVNGIWDDYGPPIIAACEGRSYECLRWLLTHGARIAGRGAGATRPVAWNALVSAAHFKDKPEMLTLLLDHGADPNSPSEATGEEGMSALHVVASQGNIAGVRILLTHGADRRLEDKTGRSPLVLARNKSIARLLSGSN
jgi:ankyrin repeat protein